MDLPTIKHANVVQDSPYGFTVQMNEGYAFWLKNAYIDSSGEMYEPEVEELYYSTKGYFPLSYDFSLLVVVDISTIDQSHIVGVEIPPKTM